MAAPESSERAEGKIETVTQLDFAVLDWISKALSSPLMDRLMTAATRLGDSGTVWMMAAALLLLTERHRRDGVRMLLTLFLCFLCGSVILKPIIARPRPCWLRPQRPLLIPVPSDFSFPSGHTMTSFGAAGALFLGWRRAGAAALFLAAVIGFSRLYLFVHFPTDVLAGMVLGLVLARVSDRILDRIWPKGRRRGENTRLKP